MMMIALIVLIVYMAILWRLVVFYDNLYKKEAYWRWMSKYNRIKRRLAKKTGKAKQIDKGLVA